MFVHLNLAYISFSHILSLIYYYFFNLICTYRRQEKSILLGFENYAFLSLDSKMAGSPSEVWKMITDLQNKSKGAAQAELRALQVTNKMIAE